MAPVRRLKGQGKSNVCRNSLYFINKAILKGSTYLVSGEGCESDHDFLLTTESREPCELVTYLQVGRAQYHK